MAESVWKPTPSKHRVYKLSQINMCPLDSIDSEREVSLPQYQQMKYPQLPRHIFCPHTHATNTVTIVDAQKVKMCKIAESLNIASELVAVNGPKVRLWSGWANVCVREKPPGCKLNQTNAPLLHPIHSGSESPCRHIKVTYLLPAYTRNKYCSHS